MSEFFCPGCGAALIVAVKPKAEKARTVEDVRALFPSELEEMLIFQENKDYIIMKTRRFLGSNNFARIAAIVRAQKGEYVSAGKDSHFKIPKTES